MFYTFYNMLCHVYMQRFAMMPFATIMDIADWMHLEIRDAHVNLNTLETIARL